MCPVGQERVNNAQYHHRELLEINPVPASIGDDVFKINVCKALSLTGYDVKPHDLQACWSPFEEKGHCDS